MNLVLIDTSVWINILRERGDDDLTDRAKQILREGRAAWCSMIQLELWSGIGGAEERKRFSQVQAAVRDLEINHSVWQLAIQTADIARSRGITAPPADYLIHACARVHNATLWHCDKHFDALAKL